jgi:hypothetical protein
MKGSEQEIESNKGPVMWKLERARDGVMDQSCMWTVLVPMDRATSSSAR